VQSLQKDHITDLYVMVDDRLIEKEKPLGGRPNLLSDSELATIFIWSSLATKQKTLKEIHKWINMYHKKEFPQFPNYSAFVDHSHRIMPQLLLLLKTLLSTNDPIRFMDSTMLPVCKLIRSDRHKVAKGFADYGKNHQGWHFGFKLHASIDRKGKFAGLSFTSASCHDAQSGL